MKKFYVLLLASLLIFTGCDKNNVEKDLTTKMTTTTTKEVVSTSQPSNNEETTSTSTTKPIEDNETTSKTTTTTTTTVKTTTTKEGTLTKAPTTTTTKKTTTTTKPTTKTTTTTKKTTPTTKKTTTTTKKTTTTTKKTTTTAKNLTEKQVYNAMIALKSKYPNGTPWDNSYYYGWKGGIFSGGYGCAGFAFMLSDAAFGNVKAKQHKNFDNVKVGDIIRYLGDSHSVIVLEVKSSSFIVAEGNYNASVHWGREISLSEVKSTGTYVFTRW